MPNPRPRLTTACTIAAASGAVSMRAHEARVDLELVEREPAQIQQARIAGAEVVERETHPDCLEPQHRQFRGLQVAEQRALGQFEFEPALAIKIGFLEDALDHVRRSPSGGIAAATRSPRRSGRATWRPSRQARRSIHSPSSTISPECLRDRNKDCTGGITPAGSGGSSAPAPRPPTMVSPRGIDDRLIGGANRPSPSDRVQQIAFQQLALRQVGVHRRIVDAGAIAAFVLGAIKRHVGVAQNIAGVARRAGRSPRCRSRRR